MFIWARLNGGVLATELLQHAIAHKVIFVPGEGFQAENIDRSMLRLSFATPTLEQMAEGAKRLGEALQAARSAHGLSSTVGAF